MRTKSVNNATEHLCITRTPLMRVLNEFEESTKCQLFIRKYGKLEPTEAAVTLYEKIKPLYDTLILIEEEYSGTSSRASRALELLFDISVPHILFQYITARLSTLNPRIVCRRVSIATDDVSSLLSHPDVALFTYRPLPAGTPARCYPVGTESVVLLLPDVISQCDLSNSSLMQSLIFYIRRERYFYEVKEYILQLTGHRLPSLNIQGTDNEIPASLFSVSAGNGAIILPEQLAYLFSPPHSIKIKLNDIVLNRYLYVNALNKNQPLIHQVMTTLTE